MLLILLLAVAQGPTVRPSHDLASYLAIAARYASGERLPALRDILAWQPAEIDAAVARLDQRRSAIRRTPVTPLDIDARVVGAAVLLHAEAGLLGLSSHSYLDAERHLRTSRSLHEAHRDAVRERIDPRDYNFALAATALAFGYSPLALELAEKARDVAPRDAEVQLVLACAAEAEAEGEALRRDARGATRLRREAAAALQEALDRDPGLTEARLRLGYVHLLEGRLPQAEVLLREAEARGDDRLRYLARLFLARAAERAGRRAEANGLYRRALEAWPDAQTACLALALAREQEAGPGAARELVAASLAASQRKDRAPDPWWTYSFGPPGVAAAALGQLFTRGLAP